MAVEILGRRIPAYDLLLIAIGPVVLLLVWLLLTRTRWGALVRAATQVSPGAVRDVLIQDLIQQ